MAQVRIEDHMDEVKALIEESLITALEITGQVVEYYSSTKPEGLKTQSS